MYNHHIRGIAVSDKPMWDLTIKRFVCLSIKDSFVCTKRQKQREPHYSIRDNPAKSLDMVQKKTPLILVLKTEYAPSWDHVGL